MRSSVAWPCLLLLASGCGSPRPSPRVVHLAAAPRVERIAVAEPVILRLATFNIHVLGPAKAGRPEVPSILAELVRRHDLGVRGQGTLFDDSAHDYFQREPYLSRFEVLDTGVSFILINVHTRPRSALQESAAMEHVFAWAEARYGKDEVFLAVGDFNAGCG